MTRRHSDEDEDSSADKVKRELSKDEIEKRKDEFGEVSLQLLELRDKKTLNSQRANLKIKDLTARVRELRDIIRDGHEWVPAQLELADAAKSRRGVNRSVQTPGPAAAQ